MKTVYSKYDNCIFIKIVSDKGSLIHSRACVTYSEHLNMLQIDSISINNFDLTPVKFSCFCRMVSNTCIQILLSRADIDFVEFDPELDFELG